MSTISVPRDVFAALLACADEFAPPGECDDVRAAADGLLSDEVSRRFLSVAKSGEFLLVDTEHRGSHSARFSPIVVATGYREQIERLAETLNRSPEALLGWDESATSEEPF